MFSTFWESLQWTVLDLKSWLALNKWVVDCKNIRINIISIYNTHWIIQYNIILHYRSTLSLYYTTEVLYLYTTLQKYFIFILHYRSTLFLYYTTEVLYLYTTLQKYFIFILHYRSTLFLYYTTEVLYLYTTLQFLIGFRHIWYRHQHPTFEIRVRFLAPPRHLLNTTMSIRHYIGEHRVSP